MSLDYSVMIPIYIKADVSYFKIALESILNQSVKSNDICILAGGPLSEEMEITLKHYMSLYPCIHLHRIKENKGIGYSRHLLLDLTMNEIVANMDADDVSDKYRMEKQLNYIAQDYDFVGSIISDFVGDDPCVSKGLRVTPKTKKELLEFSKKRSPFNNVTLMFRKSAAKEFGGYQDRVFGEDYCFGIDILTSNSKVINIQEPLVYVRTGESQGDRRSGRIYKKAMKSTRLYALNKGLINKKEYRLYNFETWVFCSLPYWMKRILYKIRFRK